MVVNCFSQNNYCRYVNPFIGTGGHGHTFPGAVLPFGMVQLSPDTRVDGSWDGCSGYHRGDSLIYGFSHTHLSGTGCSDWGDILLMPTLGQPDLNKKTYASRYSHSTERAEPGFYAVTLKQGNVKAELTATTRVGIHRYTFPASEETGVVLDLLHRDKTLGCNFEFSDSSTVIGFRKSEAWAKEQHVYFVIKFSKAFKRLKTFSGGKEYNREKNNPGRLEGAYMTFDLSDGKPLIVKVGISGASMQGALRNLTEEAPHWDFDRYRQEAADVWNKQLSKIEVEGAGEDQMSVFYTALYHCFIHPSTNVDVDNYYRGRDNQQHYASRFTNYSVFSLWDTYRALHPLFTILETKRTNDFITSFLTQYRQSGRLPVWELSSNETDCMIGFHSVSVIADAMVKGIRGFDTLLAYDAMRAASEYSAFGIPTFNKNGFLQVDDESESVSRSLEYAYDNWCIAQAARLFKKGEDEKMFLRRSLAYMNLFDASTGHMRPRKNGGWLSPFYANDINNHFTEGNSWHYSFYVPHDIEGLVKLHGGSKRFEAKLDELFNSPTTTRGREQADVTGLIGQYAHGNEPSHHMAYLYNYVGRPQKTIGRLRQICNDFYKNSDDGLIGNEDCGQMSAWYVFSAMGFYPVCPGSTQYVLGEPRFSSVRINLENGKSFTIKGSPALNREVTGIRLNGVAGKQSFLDHSAIMSGGSLEFMYDELGGKENLYGAAKSDCPASAVTGTVIIPAPIIRAPGQIFKDTMTVSIEQINVPVTLINLYTLDRSEPGFSSKIYARPIRLDSSCVLKAQTLSNEHKSVVQEARFFKVKTNFEITLLCKLGEQYTAEGPQTLADGIKGDANWKKGNWLGCQGQDFSCVVDMKDKKDVSSLSLQCLQDTPAWIVFPSEVSFFGSNDNKQYVPLQTVKNAIDAKDNTAQVRDFKAELKQKVKFRYIKVVAKNYGKLPAWHPGAGGESYIFAGELEIK